MVCSDRPIQARLLTQFDFQLFAGFYAKKSLPAWICSSVGCSWLPLESLISCLLLCWSHNDTHGTRPLKQRNKMCTDVCSNRTLSKSKHTLILSFWSKQSILWELSKWLIQVLQKDEVKSRLFFSTWERSRLSLINLSDILNGLHRKGTQTSCVNNCMISMLNVHMWFHASHIFHICIVDLLCVVHVVNFSTCDFLHTCLIFTC